MPVPVRAAVRTGTAVPPEQHRTTPQHPHHQHHLQHPEEPSEERPVSDDVTVEEPSEQAPDVDAVDAVDVAEADAVDGAPDHAPDGADGADAAEADGRDLEARAEDDPRSRSELLGDLDRTEAQRDEYLDDLRRSHADFENYRKRVARDVAQQRDQGRADVVAGLLEVLDDLDRVVDAAAAVDTEPLPADAGAVVSGVRVVADKARRALEALGVERVADTGVPFDPTVHDAVQQVDGDGVEQPTVHEVLRPGYRSGDRVVRAAMVVVAQ